MPDMHEFWDPNEWELHVFGLLQDRHGPLNVMKAPSRHRGDCGLDYYCLRDRVVYQCYAVQEPCEVANRADKQKRKITADLEKFCKRTADLKALFAGVLLDRWVLLVPLHDSIQVNLHLSQKSADVRALGLSYVSSGFEAQVNDLDCFEDESRAARASQRLSLSFPRKLPGHEQIADWGQANNPLVSALERKLRKRVGDSDPARLGEAVRLAIGHFLETENTIESLRQTSPQLYESLKSAISAHGENLRFFGPPSDGTANRILRDEVALLSSTLQERVPNLSRASAEQIALGTVAELLLRCPLDFPPYDYES